MTYHIIDAFVNDGLLNQRIQMRVPLAYHDEGDVRTISICANVTQRYVKDLHGQLLDKVVFSQKAKVIAYLQGGPGFPCEAPRTDSGFAKVLLDKGYQIVFYDQRGTGFSSPIEGSTLASLRGEHDALEYLVNFRADSIVEDMERLRMELLGNQKWLLLGQSFGGFCLFTYLSMYAESLSEVLVTGGIPPIGHTADHVYTQTYKRTKERNVHYYNKYAQDEARVRDICQYLATNRVALPNGGILSVERFQQLGLGFGAAGGTDTMHSLVTELWHSLQTLRLPTYRILCRIQDSTSFDTNVLYALFQEAIYCDGTGNTNWAADRLRYAAGNEPFVYSCGQLTPVYFTGEMVYRSMYEDYAELRPFAAVAHALHAKDAWPRLYRPEILSKITWDQVPIVAACYFQDQYVDFSLCMQVKQEYFGERNLRQHVTSEFFHNGLRACPERVLGALFKLLECEVD